VHHVPRAGEDLLSLLKGSFEMRVHVTQHVSAPPDRIGTGNSIVVESIRSGEPKGYEAGGADKPKSAVCFHFSRFLLSSDNSLVNY